MHSSRDILMLCDSAAPAPKNGQRKRQELLPREIGVYDASAIDFDHARRYLMYAERWNASRRFCSSPRGAWTVNDMAVGDHQSTAGLLFQLEIVPFAGV